MKKINIMLLISFFVVVLDQTTKYIIVKSISLNESIPVIKNVLHITYVMNTGAGFGIFKNMNSILIWITLFIVGLVFFYYDKIPKGKFPQIFTGLIVGGAIGNLIDRISVGHVIDFIDARIWPVFNVADSAITIGAIGLIIFFWKK